MTSDDVKQRITEWCSADDDLEIAGDRFEPGTDFVFGLRASSPAGAPVDLLVLRGEGADRITIRRTANLTGDEADTAQKLVDSRSGTVAATIDRSGAGTAVTAWTFVYLDGLSKHTFAQAVAELARTSRLLDALGAVDAEPVAAAAATTAVEAEPEPVAARVAEPVQTPTPSAFPAYTPAPAQTPAPSPFGIPVGQPFNPQPVPQPAAQPAQPMPAPSFTPQPVLQQAPQPMPAPANQWVPSHSVPAQGMRAWGAPDPAGPVVANLAPGLPIQVAEVRGAWARVVCSNGWTGWVDGRIIGVAA